MSDYQQQEEEEIWANIARTDPSTVVGEEPLATERQVSYMEALRDGKDLSSLKPEQIAWLRDADFKKVPKRRASDVIGQMKALPWMPRDAAHGVAPTVKDGRYAVYVPRTFQEVAGIEAHSPGADSVDSVLKFYSIKRGTSITFVDVWASDARWPVKNSAHRAAILKAIENDPDAGPRFGREIGRCYVCGRTLTDESSRAAGIGPICAAGL
jgi:hypothetical protein